MVSSPVDSTDNLSVASNNEPKKVSYLSKIPGQVKRLAHNKGATFTVMVAGESGLGKTTFVRAVFGKNYSVTKSAKTHGTNETNSLIAKTVNIGDSISPIPQLSLPPYGTATGQEADISAYETKPTTKIEIHQVVAEENGFATHLTVIDTPGFGDYTDNSCAWYPLVDYIDTQHQHYMLQEEQPNRTLITDNRVHLCLYFLAPSNRILELDLKAMQELSTRVNVVPVIAKADSLTPNEMIMFKDLARNAIEEHQIEIWQPQSDFNTMKEYNNVWPFALISSESMVFNNSSKRVRGRTYRWGSVEIDNPEYSDLVLLRNILFSNGMLDLIEATTLHYRALRRKYRLVRFGKAFGMEVSESNVSESQLSHNSDGVDPKSILMGYLKKNEMITEDKLPKTTAELIEAAANSMGEIETLSVISSFGSAFLRDIHQQSSGWFLQQVSLIKSEFARVLEAQEQRFGEKCNSIEQRRRKYMNSHDALQEQILALTAEIEQLQNGIKRRRNVLAH